MLAGDTLPIDVYCHIPIMCEDRSLPYAYVPSKSVSAEAGEEPALVMGNPVRSPGCDRSLPGEVQIRCPSKELGVCP